MTRVSAVARLLGRERWIVSGALALIVAGAAAYIVTGGGTGMAPRDMAAGGGAPGMDAAATWTPGYAAAIFTMWWLMMVAMMVPSAAPTILLYGALHRDSGSRGMLGFLAGYLVVWAGFSLAATAAQGLLAAAGLMAMMSMTVGTKYLGAAVLVAAGLYQWTPLKAACLAHCRGPIAALTTYRRTGRWAAFRMGAWHGTFCLGCCWGLMALLFVGGVMNLWWILGVALYVAAEKLVPHGDHLARPLGAVLIAAGLALFFRAAGLV